MAKETNLFNKAMVLEIKYAQALQRNSKEVYSLKRVLDKLWDEIYSINHGK